MVEWRHQFGQNPTREAPLLSNILLDDLDKELEKRGHQFCRYADDLIILVKSKQAGERVMASVTSFLEKNLKVQVNRDKSKVGTAESSTFLSFTFHLKRPTVSRKAFTDFKSEIKRLTGRSWAYPWSIDARKSAPTYRGG